MTITQQKARKMLSELGWRMINQGKVWYSRNMKFQISMSHYPRLFFMKPCNPNW